MSDYPGVALFYADDGQDWARYLRLKLSSKEYAIHSELNNIRDDPNEHTRSKNVNIFLVSPDFLDLPDWDIMKEFNPNTSLAILTGIDLNDLTKQSRRKNCHEVLDWLIHELTDSEDDQQRNKSIRDMMVTIVAAYEGALHEERSPHGGSAFPGDIRRTVSHYDRVTRSKKRPTLPGVSTEPREASPYDFLPPQRQVNDVLTYVKQDDLLIVVLQRPADGSLQIEYAKDVSTPQMSNPACVYVFPYPKDVHGQSFKITLDGRELGEHGNKQGGDDTADGETKPQGSTKHTETRHGTSTLPQPCRRFKDIGVQTESSEGDSERPRRPQLHRQYSSKLDQIYDLIKDELDPKELLCKCLGIGEEITTLDEKLTAMIEDMETFKHLSQPHGDDLREETTSSSVWPTLLHFGAQYNLLNFCDALLSNQLMFGACLIRNKAGFCPDDLARQHGHTELAVLLKHFSNYVAAVGREGKYDSGFSCGTPRLSTITLPRESQTEVPSPKPHRTLSKGYTSMQPAKKEDDHVQWTLDGPPATPPRTRQVKSTRTISDDFGLGEEEYFEEPEDVDESIFTGPSPNSSLEENKDLFGDLLEFSPDQSGTLKAANRCISTGSTGSNTSSKSSFYTDEEIFGDSPIPNRKDITSFLGVEHHKSPTEKKGLLKFFRKKGRSTSESALSNSLPKSKTKVYKKDSNRSSSTSTSSNSSTNFPDLKASEENQVQLRDDVQKSKTKFKLFMSNAKRRKSIRIKNVLEDKNLSGPTLPPRRVDVSETF